jgi:hypothetical protein
MWRTSTSLPKLPVLRTAALSLPVGVRDCVRDAVAERERVGVVVVSSSVAVALAALVALAAVVAVCYLPSAFAAPGDHIRFGNAVLAPSATTGFEYHSNLYLADGDEQACVVTQPPL